MNDKQIKQALMDASRYLNDASKRWPNHKDTAKKNFDGAQYLMDLVLPYLEYYVDRPLVGKEKSDG